MKIALVLGAFPTISETFIVNQITDLIDKGHEVSIFAFQKNNCEVIHQGVLEYNLLEKTVYFQEIQISKFGRYFDFLKFIVLNRKHINFFKIIQIFNFQRHGKKAINLRNYTKFKWILNHASFDIIHVHFGTNATYIAQMKALGYFANTRFITSFHGYDISPHLMNTYPKKYELLLQEVDLITANTKYTKSLIQNLTNSHKIEILPVGLDTGKFKKNRFNKNQDFTMLFIGRLIELKGPHLTVEILNSLVKRGHKNIKLIIVGEGELKDLLVELIGNYNLQEKVKLTGALSQESIIELMETADVFLLPGIYDKNGRAETQGLVIQEAQSMELPVIISDVGGMKFGLIDRKTGFVVKEKDIEDFSNKIELLIENESLRTEMGRKARKFVVANYDSKMLGERLEKLYYQKHL
ncbi:glycosyltransferase [Salegentibacter sp. BDJ18]|uniref:glycosyltransferase n=1 Tax=Salegentibacter sp. BDJ18 TaxID=2816376 RepID=UPI001AB006E4|nr:glycosyltransferase [Salegentibacter sp. BDJ18]MBO2544280.1 glycosyltransferase [Salegentibacter sp. BDJ18]